MFIKICANTNLEDALAAVEAGANALGFVFAAESPRQVTPEAAAQIVSQLPSGVAKIGVFVNEDLLRVRAIVRQVGLTGVQLHGEETIAYAEQLFAEPGRPKIYRGLSMRSVFSVTSGAAVLRSRAQAAFDAVVVDSGSHTRHGGTGLTFDWTRAQPFIANLRKRHKVIVAGGLNAENVARAIALFRPWGVDIASGVEREPGKKDPEKIRAFIAAARQASM